VIRDYLHNHGTEEARGPKLLRELAYPLQQEALFDSVINEITENMGWGADEPPPEEHATVATQTVDDVPSTDLAAEHTESYVGDDFDIYTISGNVHTEKVARILYNSRRIERAFWMTFHGSAQDYLTDLLALRYLALDHSRPTFRIMVAGSYGLGFVILFIPTVITFFLVLRQVIGL
jgi:hypothetical protein